MKLVIAQLKAGENLFQFASPQEKWLQDALANLATQGTRVVGPLDVKLSLTNLEPDYYLKGRMVFTVDQTCVRCAETFPLPVEQAFELGLAHVKTAGREAVKPSLSEESEELDIQYFEGNELDLTPLLQEQILLSLPYAPVCSPECKGICQACGTNLNLGVCHCQKKIPVNAFAVLAKTELKSHGRSQET